MGTELLHRQIALRLRQVTVQRLRIITVTNQFVGNLLRLQLRATEDDGENLRIVIDNTFQCQVFVFGIHQIIDMVDVLGTFVARTHHNLLVFMEV